MSSFQGQGRVHQMKTKEVWGHNSGKYWTKEKKPTKNIGKK